MYIMAKPARLSRIQCLSLMELVTGHGRCPPQIKAVSQSCERAATGFVEGLSLPHHRLEAFGQKSTDRSALLGSEDTRFTKKIRIELERNVRFHAFPKHAITCSTNLRANGGQVNPRSSSALYQAVGSGRLDDARCVTPCGQAWGGYSLFAEAAVAGSHVRMRVARRRRPKGRHYGCVLCGTRFQLCHVNSRVRGAKVAEDLALVVAAKAVA